MNLGKRFLALLLAMTMILSNLPVSVLAEEFSADTDVEIAAEVPTETSTEASTETSTEASTEAPTEASTEAPTQAPTEEPTEAPTEAPEETVAPTEEVLEQEPITEAEYLGEEDGEPYLSQSPIQKGEDGLYRPIPHKIQGGITISPGDTRYSIFFLNVYDAGTDQWTSTPVDVVLDCPGVSMTRMTSGIAPDAENSNYYREFTSTVWDQFGYVYYMYGDTRLELIIDSGLSYTSFHTAYSTDVLDLQNSYIPWSIGYELSNNADENVLYYRAGGETLTVAAKNPDDGQVTEMDGKIYEIKLSESFLNRVKNGDETELYLLYTDEYGEYEECITCTAASDVSHEPYLMMSWLSSDENGYYEGQPNEADTFRVRPGEIYYHIYYLNVWDDEAQAYTHHPVHVQTESSAINLERMTQEIHPDATNREYYYKVTANEWDQQPVLFCEYEGQSVTMIAHTDLGEQSFHTGYPCTHENFISFIDGFELSNDPAENVVYFRFDDYFWNLNSIELDNADWAELTDLGGGVWQVNLTEAFRAEVKQFGLDLNMTLHLTGKENSSSTTQWRSGLFCWQNTDYLSWSGLRNHGGGFLEEVREYNLMLNIRPGDDMAMVFYLNEWNPDTEEYTPRPVHVQTDISGAALEKISAEEVAEGQTNADYFYRFSVSSWDDAGNLYYMHNGEKLYIPVKVSLGTYSYHTTEECTTGDYLAGGFRVDPFAQENAFYVRFSDDYWTLTDLQPVPEHNGHFTTTKVRDGVYKLTLEPWVVEDVYRYNGRSIDFNMFLSAKDDPDHTEQWWDSCWLESRAPFLQMLFLEDHGDGFFEPEEGYWGRDFRIYPVDEFAQIFYLYTWDEAQGGYTAAPVHVQTDNAYLTLEKIPADQAAEGQGCADYFYKVTTSQWDQTGEIYCMYEGKRITMPVYTGLGEESFHTGIPCTTDNFMGQWILDSEAEEHTAYFRFESDYWEISSIEPVDFQVGKYSLTPVGNGIYQIDLTDEFVLASRYQQNLVLNLTLQAKDDPDQKEHRVAEIGCRWENEWDTLETFMSLGWLRNDGQGFYEQEYHDERSLNVRPDDESFVMFYKNVWNGEAWDAIPVQVQSDDTSIIQVEQLSAEQILSGQPNAAYFYRVTSLEWNAEATISPVDEPEVKMNVTTGLGTYSYHTDPSCTVENVLWDFRVDPKAQENAFYLRFEDDFWDLKYIETLTGGLHAEPVEEGRIYKLSIEPWLAEEIHWDGGRDVDFNLVVQPKHDPNHEEKWWDCCFAMSTEPYLFIGWLRNDGQGFYEGDDVGARDFRVRPGEEMHQIYYLREWNEELGDFKARPVHVQSTNDCLSLQSLANEAREGEEHAEYFYRVTTSRWFEDVEVYCLDSKGEKVSMTVYTALGEESFHSGPNCSTGNFMVEWVFDPFAAEKKAYFLFESDHWTVKNVQPVQNEREDQTGLYDIVSLGNGVYEITLGEEFVETAITGRYLNLMLTLVSTHDQHEETRTAGINCRADISGCLAMLGINGDTYEVFGADKYIHHYPTGEYWENGDRVWAMELTNALPAGFTYDASENKLTLNNAKGSHLNLNYYYREENGYAGYNLPNANLTIELIGENELISDEQEAMWLWGNVNVTFVGDGSLYVKSSNKISNEDRWGNPYHFPAWNMEGGSLIIGDNVSITAEIAGEGLEGIWDDEGNLVGTQQAFLLAMYLQDTRVTIQENASVTTKVPKGGRDSGNVLNEHNERPGGYGGIEGYRTLQVLGGTLTTSGLRIGEEYTENGTLIKHSYVQTGGVVNITGLGYHGVHEELGIDHYHYSGIEGGEGGLIRITGGQLNIDVTPTEAEHASSSYFFAIQTRGGNLFINGGEINITSAYEGNAFQIENQTHVELNGGTINAKGTVGNGINFMDLTPGSTAEFNGGTINAEFADFMLGGEVIYNGTEIYGECSVVSVDNSFEMNGGLISLSYGRMFANGAVRMEGGKLDLRHSFLHSYNGFEFHGGEIDIDYVHEDSSPDGGPPALGIFSYFEIEEGATLTINSNIPTPSIDLGGHLQLHGGSINVNHANPGAPAVSIFYMEDADPEENATALYMDGGELNISAPEGAELHNGIASFDGRWLLILGGKLNLTGMNLEYNGVVSANTAGQVNVTNGRVYVGEGGVLDVGEGGQFKIDSAIAKRVDGKWYTALLAEWTAEVTINGGSLTVNGENFDCAMDVCGSYVQDGGTVKITATSDDGVANGLGAALKGAFELKGGSLTLTGVEGLQIGCPVGEQNENSHYVISGGKLTVNGQHSGIYQEGHLEITGGDVDVNITGRINNLNKLIGQGFRVITWEGEEGQQYEATLTISGGTVDVKFDGSQHDFDGIFSGIGILAVDSDVNILGGEIRVTGGIYPIYSECADPSMGLAMGDDMVFYSMKSGKELELLDYTFQMDGVTYYSKGFEEDNEPGDIYTDEGVDYVHDLVVRTGICGEDTTWKLVDGTLKIQGSGFVNSYTSNFMAPWNVLSGFITKLEIGGNVSHLGGNAFSALKKVDTVTFLGNAPSFDENAFAGLKAAVLYPADKAGWVSTIRQNYGGTMTWIPNVDGVVIDVKSSAKYLMPGESATLTYELSEHPEDLNLKVLWSLAAGSEEFATLTVENGVATVTAKTVTEKKIIQVNAIVEGSHAAPYVFELPLYAPAEAVKIFRGSLDVTGETLAFDYEKQPVALTAQLVPNDIAQSLDPIVSWSSSDEDVATVEDGVVTFKQYDSVKITVKALDGSGKSASVTLEPYFRYNGDLTAELCLNSLRLDKPVAEGLQVGDQARIIVTSAEGRLVPASELTYEIIRDEECVTIDEEGIIEAIQADGSVRIQVTLTGDLDNRKETVSLDTIPAVPEKILLNPHQEGEVEGTSAAYHGYIHAAGFVDFGSKGGLNLFALTGDKQEFTLDAEGWHSILDQVDVQGLVRWSTDDRSVATVKEASDGTVTITIPRNAEGSCTITAVSELDETVSVTIGVYVCDYMPELEESTITLNTVKIRDSETVAVLAHDDNQVEDAAIRIYDKESEAYVDTTAYEADYADGAITVTSLAPADAGTVKAELTLTMEYGDPVVLPLTIKVVNKTPKITVRQTKKLNVLGEMQGILNITVSDDEVLTNVELADCGYEILNPEATDGIYRLGLSSKENADFQDGSGTLKFTVDGFLEIPEKSIRLVNDSKSSSLELNMKMESPSDSLDIAMAAMVEVFEYNSETKTYEPSENLYADSDDSGLVTLTPAQDLEKGTLKAQLVVWAQDGRSGIHNVNVKIVEKLPAITIKQSRKVNSDEINGELTITAKDTDVIKAEFVDADCGYEILNPDATDGIYQVALKADGDMDALTGTLEITLDGYKPEQKTFKLSTETKAATVTLNKAMETTAPYTLVDLPLTDVVPSVSIAVYDKTSKDYVELPELTASYAEGKARIEMDPDADLSGTVKARLTVHASGSLGGIMNLNIKIVDKEPSITVKQTRKLNTTALTGLINVTSADGIITKVALADCGYEILDPTADGEYEVILTGDPADLEGTLEITLDGFETRTQKIKLSADSKSYTVTLNTYLTDAQAGANVALTRDVQVESSSVYTYDSAEKVYVLNNDFTASYADGKVTVAYEGSEPMTGSLKAQVRMNEQNITCGIVNLTIKASNKAPAITIKQVRKVNLLDENSFGLLTVTAKDETVTGIVLDEKVNFYHDGETDEEGNFIIYCDGVAKPVTRGTVTVLVDGYREDVVTKTFTIATEKVKNKAILEETTVYVYRNLPDMTGTTGLSTYFVDVPVDEAVFTPTSDAGKKLDVRYEYDPETQRGVITVDKAEGQTEWVKRGTYKFTAIPKVGDTSLAKITLSVKVEDAPKVTIKPTSVKLSLAQQGEQVAEVAVSAPVVNGYGLSFKEVLSDGTEGQNDEIAWSFDEATGLLKAELTEQCTTTGRKIVYLKPVYGEVELDATVKLTVNVSK